MEPGDGPGSSEVAGGERPRAIAPSKRRRGSGRALFLALLVATTFVGVAFASAVASPPPTAAPSRATYELQGSMALTFPECSLVHVSWNDLAGRDVQLSVAQGGEASLVYDCGASHNSPGDGCPPTMCLPGRPSMGVGPFEYETAARGSLEFTATQSSYAFFTDEPNSCVPSNGTVQLNVTSAAPLVPISFALPLLGVLAALLIGVVVAGLGLRRTGRRTRP
jgi:hypothetical protein